MVYQSPAQSYFLPKGHYCFDGYFSPGKHTKSHGKSPFLVGKISISTINGSMVNLTGARPAGRIPLLRATGRDDCVRAPEGQLSTLTGEGGGKKKQWTLVMGIMAVLYGHFMLFYGEMIVFACVN